MVAFVKDIEFQSFFAKGCFFLHVSMALWKVYFERRLEVLAWDWPRQVIGDFILELSRVFFFVYSWREKHAIFLNSEFGGPLHRSADEFQLLNPVTDSLSDTILPKVFGLLSMVAALAVMVPATLVTWIAIVVLLAFFGKPRRALVVEGRKITREIVGFVIKILLKEGNLVAAVCAVLGYFALVRKSGEVD
ncbi:hypothetical protein FEM48_Zijuj04G0121000 [Ziziphus jujuba var. spinosa]|uniref:DUF7865 domain-containing protein n=1 Tax=Ziziphus jujuba var. spinosa TaxID=714518 RepID=A0A978VJS6_ZIZJJ|nr:hypothetical protein FEM48_Zijuj04G0121000 [Ziziphus jujuba var. spinosa]